MTKRIAFLCNLILAFFTTVQSYGQFAIINDGKGYVDVKSDTLDNSETLGRIFADDIFWDGIQPYDSSTWHWIDYMPEMNTLEANKRIYYKNFLKTHCWTEFVFDENGKISFIHSRSDSVHIEGYIRQEKARSIEELEHLKHKMINPSKTLFWNDSIEVEIGIIPFDKSKHNIEMDKQHAYLVKKIDNRDPIMVDVFPVDEFSEIKVSIRGKKIVIPKSEYKNVFDCELRDFGVYLDTGGNIYIYKADNSAGGGFAVIWLIKKGKYLKRDIGGDG